MFQSKMHSNRSIWCRTFWPEVGDHWIETSCVIKLLLCILLWNDLDVQPYGSHHLICEGLGRRLRGRWAKLTTCKSYENGRPGQHSKQAGCHAGADQCVYPKTTDICCWWEERCVLIKHPSKWWVHEQSLTMYGADRGGVVIDSAWVWRLYQQTAKMTEWN